MLAKIIDQEFKYITDVLNKITPNIQQVKLFGSNESEIGDENISEIDLFAVVSADKYNMNYESLHNDDNLARKSTHMEDLKTIISRRVHDNYSVKLHLVTPQDTQMLSNTDERKGYIGIDINNGRILYEKQERSEQKR